MSAVKSRQLTSSSSAADSEDESTEPLMILSPRDVFVDLRCAVCYGAVREAVECVNHHLFCWGCIDQWKQTRGKKDSTNRPQVPVDPDFVVVAVPPEVAAAMAEEAAADTAAREAAAAAAAINNRVNKVNVNATVGFELNSVELEKLVEAQEKRAKTLRDSVDVIKAKTSRIKKTVEVLDGRTTHKASGIAVDDAKIFRRSMKHLQRLTTQHRRESDKIRKHLLELIATVVEVTTAHQIMYQRLTYAEKGLGSMSPDGRATAIDALGAMRRAFDRVPEAADAVAKQLVKMELSAGDIRQVDMKLFKYVRDSSKRDPGELRRDVAPHMLQEIGTTKSKSASLRDMHDDYSVYVDLVTQALTDVGEVVRRCLPLLPTVVLRTRINTDCPLCRQQSDFEPRADRDALVGNLSVACRFSDATAGRCQWSGRYADFRRHAHVFPSQN